MRHWLFKSEPQVYSIADLARDRRTCWDGVRNYQARNFLRDEVRVGDAVLFYHSSTEPAGVAGIARVCRAAYPDSTALDRKHEHYDPKSTPDIPIWVMVDIEFVARFKQLVTLDKLRNTKGLEGLMLLKRGQRLSIQPVSQAHFNIIEKLGRSL